MILLLHNRYRVPGGEERAIDDLAWLIREHLAEDVEILQRDSGSLSQHRAAAAYCAAGSGRRRGEAVRRTGARVVHAHNVNPTLGWRALAAAREAGARVVLHLHNYRLVCAVGTCFTHGEDCTRCHGRNTLPGVALNCRGGSVAELAAYAASLALWQREMAAQVDRFLVPSAFALRRLRQLGRARRRPGVGAVVRPARVRRGTARGRRGGTSSTRGALSHEKGVADAVVACRAVGLPLAVAGDGPAEAELRQLAAGTDVRFTGRVGPERLAELRREAAVAVVPSRYAEILPLAALEAMAAGVPVVASRSGGLAELVPEEGLFAPGDADALGARARRLWGDAAAGERALAVVRERTAPGVVAHALALAEAYGRGLVLDPGSGVGHAASGLPVYVQRNGLAVRL